MCTIYKTNDGMYVYMNADMPKSNNSVSARIVDIGLIST